MSDAFPTAQRINFPDVRLSVVIPAYNEAENVGANLERALAALRRHVGTFEIVFVDDGSRDETGVIADRIAAGNPELRVYRNATNLGQGGSLKRGFALAGLDWVMHNAIDYPFDFDDLPKLLKHVESSDVIVASRKTYPGTSLPRRSISFANRALIRGLFGTSYRDYNFVQIYRRSVMNELPSISAATSFITPEKIIRADRRGFRIVEVEVEYHRRERGTPSSASWKNIRAALRDMGRLWWESP